MLVTLLHLCDSLFPTGAFAHSDGLEAATASGRICSGADLRDWMDVCLDEGLARVDGPAVLRSWHAWTDQRLDDLDALDAEVHALRPSSTARAASRAMGSRLIKTWQEIHSADRVLLDPAAKDNDSTLWPTPDRTLPVAFGVICAASAIEARAAVEGFLYTRLAAIASCAMRLIPIGQREAHALVAATLARLPATVDGIETAVARGEPLGVFAPALDLVMMEQQYVHSRLFLS